MNESPAQSFVGRVAEQGKFLNLVNALFDRQAPVEGDRTPGRLLLVTGPGGIGKSSLLQQFRAALTGDLGSDRQLSLAYVDWSAPEHALAIVDSRGPEPEDMMSVLVKQLRAALGGWRGFTKRGAFDDFDKAVRQIVRQRTGVRPLGGGSDRNGAEIAGAITAGIVGATPLAPAREAIEAVVRVTYGAVAGRLTDRTTPRLDGGRQACRDGVAKGIREVTSVRPLVVILDTCELLGAASEDLQVLIRHGGPQVLWVLGVRLEPLADAASDSITYRYHDATDPGRAEQLVLSGFDVLDIDKYLRAQGQSGTLRAEDLSQLHTLTNGVPLAISLTASLLASGVAVDDLLSSLRPNTHAADLIRRLAERYLRHAEKIPGLRDDLPRLYGLALLSDHVTDYKILAAIWDVAEDKVGDVLKGLADRHDFVHSGHLAQPQAVMHDLVRETLRRNLFDERVRSTMRPANERAIRYVGRRLAASPLRGLERQLSPAEQDDHVQAWQAYALALLWHTFWVDAADGVALTRHLYPPAAVLAPVFAEHQAAIVGRQLESPTLRARQMVEAIARSSGSSLDGSALGEVLDDLARSPIADGPYAREVPLHAYHDLLVVAHSSQLGGSPGYWIEKLAKIDSSLRARPTGRPADIEQTIEVVKVQALRISAVAAAAGAYDDAIKAIDLVLAWDSEDSTAHRHLALAHAALGHSGEAEREFKIAIRVDPDHAELHSAFGELLTLAGAGDEGGRRAALDWALRLVEREGTDPPLIALVLRGLMPEASSQADREAETRKFFERAITTDSDTSPLQIAELRAIAHVGLGDIDRAAAEFTAAMSAWTPADKYRAALYKLLARRWPDGATVLRGKWQEIIARNPEAATPWG